MSMSNKTSYLGKRNIKENENPMDKFEPIMTRSKAREAEIIVKKWKKMLDYIILKIEMLYMRESDYII